MKHFILLSRKARTDAQFAADSAEPVGVCQFIMNAFWCSRALRRDTLVHIAFEGAPAPPKLLTINGAEIEHFTLIEAELAEWIKTALLKGLKMQQGEQMNVFPGISIAKQGLHPFVQKLAEKMPLYVLNRRGSDIRTVSFPEEAAFIVGDFYGLPPKTEKFLERFASSPLSLGRTMLLGSQCPIVLHQEMDRQRTVNPPTAVV